MQVRERVPVAAPPDDARAAIRALLSSDRAEPATGVARHTVRAALFGDRRREYRVAVWLTEHGDDHLALRVLGSDDGSECAVAASIDLRLTPEADRDTTVEVLADVQLLGPYESGPRSVREGAGRVLHDLGRAVSETAAATDSTHGRAGRPGALPDGAAGATAPMPRPPAADRRTVVLAVVVAALGAWLVRVRRQRAPAKDPSRHTRGGRR